MDVFRLTLLPAGDGDCLVLTWGEEGALHHMVVDGGRASAYSHLHAHLEKIASDGGTLELYVLTHIDADHVAGALSYLKAKHRPIEPRHVWFNGFAQTREAGLRSIKQGDDFSTLLQKLGWPLNRQFEAGVASVETAPKDLEVAGLKVTLLSPTRDRLRALGKDWSAWLAALAKRERGEDMRGARSEDQRPIPDPLILEDFVADGQMDTEVPNGSSIAFVAEWKGVRVLLGGDAHPDVLAASLMPLAEAEDGRYRLDLLKAPHHGSRKNLTKELVELLDCRQIAISTNGSQHGHPDPEALARFVLYGPEGIKHLWFNYETSRTRPWKDTATGEKYDFVSHFPTELQGSMEIDLMSDEPDRPGDGSLEAKRGEGAE